MGEPSNMGAASAPAGEGERFPLIQAEIQHHGFSPQNMGFMLPPGVEGTMGFNPLASGFLPQATTAIPLMPMMPSVEMRGILMANAINLPVVEVPQPGLMPYGKPSKPVTVTEMANLKKAITGRLSTNDSVVKNCSHFQVQFYRAPDWSDWRCLDCWQQADTTWEFQWIHNVGLTTSLKRPRCPRGCQNSSYEITPIGKCSQCSIILYCHEMEILQGNIFEATLTHLK